MLTEPKIMSIDPSVIRKDFPLLSRTVNNKPLVYFDNGATAQKPQVVIDAVNDYYQFHNANIHRGVHTLSQEITIAYEEARTSIQKHLNAAYAHEIIFTKGTTEAINLVAFSFGKKFIKEGDEVLISAMEHHSNILPWQQMCEYQNAILKVIPINNNGEIDLVEFKQLINLKTKLLAITHVSNTLGTINPVEEMIVFAHQHNIPVLIDGAQAVPHIKVDVVNLNADFYCFSAHKLFGPTGVGVLYGKEKWLKEMPPYQTGGGVIKTVTFEKTTFADLPLKFEAGTPHIAGAIGLAAAINYVNTLGLSNIANYENQLLVYATQQLSKIDGLRIIGTSSNKAAVISFVVDGLHPFDIGMILDKQGIAVRTGHHCTQPLMQIFGLQGTVRISFAFYNTVEEIDFFIVALKKAIKMLN
jgi:cysteine desulfurase/selenocysteine lyase